MKDTSGNEASVVACSPQTEHSSFVREIPKHLSSTGIRRISFKLSKQKKHFDDFPVIKIASRWDVKLPKKKIVSSKSYPYVSVPPVRELQGIIHSGGYLCGCTACNFSKHAGVKTKHPNNHIFLENGRAVYNIVQELKTAPRNGLEQVIRNVAGFALCEEGLQAWKGDGQLSR